MVAPSEAIAGKHDAHPIAAMTVPIKPALSDNRAIKLTVVFESDNLPPWLSWSR